MLAQALAEGEANKALVRVDPLQRLHSLANLAALLGPEGGGVAGVPRTLRDSQLLSEAARIREARPMSLAWLVVSAWLLGAV